MRLSGGLADDVGATLLEMARVQRSLGRLADARASLQRAVDYSEKLRVRVAAPDLRATYFAAKQPVYEELIDLLLQLHDTQDSPEALAAALEIGERARARSLMESLGGTRSEILRAAGPGILDKERRIVRSLSFKSQQLAQIAAMPATQSKRDSLLRDVDALELDYQRLEGEILQENPRRSQLAAAAPLSAAQIRGLLDPDTVLLEYVLGERSFVWVVTPIDLAVYRLPSRTVIEKWSRPVIELAGARQKRLAQPAEERRYRQAAAELSRILLGPVAPMLRGKLVVLSLSGILHYVPFAALPEPDNPAVPFGIEHAIARIPSASAIAALRRQPAGPPDPEAGLRITVLADPVFRGDPRISQFRGAPALDTGSGLARLPFSLREAEYIRESAPRGTVVGRLGFEANKEALSAPQLGLSSVLHLATHARIDGLHPELSGIVLSEVKPDGTPRDGLVGLYEIYNLNLPVELVVLSACRTGLGRAVDGDEFLGLSRAFLVAGAARVVMSLWNVEDESTAEFMREFYRRLLAPHPLSPPQALRAAREALWKGQWRDSSYWSGFVIAGEWRPLAACRRTL
jgi:CHAT domain-containing protein